MSCFLSGAQESSHLFVPIYIMTSGEKEGARRSMIRFHLLFDTAQHHGIE
jgi:hypothetical protein